MFASDGLSADDVKTLVSRFPGQAIDFFGAVRSQLYDEQITRFIESVGIEKVAANVVNGMYPPKFAMPDFQLAHLIEIGETLVREQARVKTMGLVSEYNQAVTPRHRRADAPYREPMLLTPPAENGLKPYGLGKAQSNSQTLNNTSSSPWKRAKAARIRRSAHGSGHSASSPSTVIPPSALQQLKQTLAMGHRLGIEYVDQRRFRVNSWQCYGTLEASTSEAEAQSQLASCLSKFQDHYVRLIAINPQTKQRLTETIVHRPG